MSSEQIIEVNKKIIKSKIKFPIEEQESSDEMINVK
jgi:hypothetical protein